MSSKLCSQCGQAFGIEHRFCPNDGSPLTLVESKDTLIGSVIADRFHILDRIGEGGMGRVYLAEHVRMGRKCAVKMISPAMASSADAITRFNREAANASRINHPNVAQIYDFGETSDGTLYLAMEFVEGESLTTMLHRERALPVRRAADIAMQVAQGLTAAHHLGIMHRDLKPDNILVARNLDGGDWVKVVDFGIAKTVDGSSSSQTLTTVGVSLGTPEYMSPEQLAGEKLDHRTDIYSLGLVLFHSMTADLPYPRVTSKETLIRRLTTAPRTLHDVRPDVEWPAVVQAVLDRSLAQEPKERYATASEMGHALAAVIADATDPAPTMPLSVVARPVAAEVATRKAPLPSGPSVPAAPRPAPPTAPVRASAPTTRIETAAPARSRKGLYAVLGGGGLLAAAAIAYASMRGRTPRDVPAPSAPMVADARGDSTAPRAPDSMTALAGAPTPPSTAAPVPTGSTAPNPASSRASKAPPPPSGGTTPRVGTNNLTSTKVAADSPAAPTRDTAPPPTASIPTGTGGPPGNALAPRDSVLAARAMRGGRGGRLDPATGRPLAGRAASAGHPWLLPNGDSSGTRRELPPNATAPEMLRFAGEEIRGHVTRGNKAFVAGDWRKGRAEFLDVAQEMNFARTYFGKLPGFPNFQSMVLGGLQSGVQTCLKAQADSLFKALPPNFRCQQMLPGPRGGGG